jgi:hypothetical protein
MPNFQPNTTQRKSFEFLIACKEKKLLYILYFHPVPSKQQKDTDKTYFEALFRESGEAAQFFCMAVYV